MIKDEPTKIGIQAFSRQIYILQSLLHPETLGSAGPSYWSKRE